MLTFDLQWSLVHCMAMKVARGSLVPWSPQFCIFFLMISHLRWSQSHISRLCSNEGDMWFQSPTSGSRGEQVAWFPGLPYIFFNFPFALNMVQLGLGSDMSWLVIVLFPGHSHNPKNKPNIFSVLAGMECYLSKKYTMSMHSLFPTGCKLPGHQRPVRHPVPHSGRDNQRKRPRTDS